MADDPSASPVPGATPPGEDALRRLLAFRPFLMAFVVSMVRDFPLAETICQDVWVAACERWPNQKPGTPFGTWVCELARRRTFALLRARAGSGSVLPSEKLVDEFERLIAELSSTPQERWEQRKEILRACLHSLPVHLQRLIEMRYAKNLSSARISEQLGREAGAVETALARARQELEACVRRRVSAEGPA